MHVSARLYSVSRFSMKTTETGASSSKTDRVGAGSTLKTKKESMYPLKIVDHIEIWPIDRLIAYLKHARIHSKTQVAQILASVRKYGFVNPILADKNGNVIAGHGRILAARDAGLTHLPVIILDHLTEAEARELRIADNKITENARWDDEMLSGELAALREEKIDLTLLGFSELELKTLLAGLENQNGNVDDDDIPDLPQLPITVPGDIWILEGDQILCASSTVLDNLAGFLKGHPADLIFTHLPYNVAHRGSA